MPVVASTPDEHDRGGAPRPDGPLPASRYGEVSRRAFLRRLAATGAGATGLAAVLAACGHDDAAVFARGSGSTGTTTGSSPGSTTAPATVPPTTGAGRSTTTAPTTTSPPTTAAPTGPAAGSMTIAFTYAASGGRVRNPYVAVWIEDGAGELVDTVALWFLQDAKGRRWLPDLRRWSSVDGSQETIETVSSATRKPGAYTLTWDLTTTDGDRIDAGPYHVCIESAREHGPYSLIRAQVTLGEGEVHQDLPANGELQDARVDVGA